MSSHDVRRTEYLNVDSPSPAAGPVPPGPPQPPRPPLLGIIIAWQMGEDGERKKALVSLDEVLSVFLPSAVRRLVRGTQHPAIDAKWAGRLRFRGRKVHLRTPGGVFQTRWKSLREALGHLSFLPAQRTYHGTVVILKKKFRLDLDGKVKRIGFVVGRDARGDAQTEWFVLSRRAARELEKLLS
jgi:hypothetical protein